SGHRPGPRFTKEQRKEAQEKFLKSFSSHGNVRLACMEAGIDRSIIHYWTEHDDEFSLQYNQAKSDVDDAIRAEIFRRGMEGDEEHVVSMGKVVFNRDGKPLITRKRSDILLMFHAKARMPEYREKSQIEVKGKIDVAGAKELLMERLARL